MIKTLDGYIKQKGDRVWSLYYNAVTELYEPSLIRISSFDLDEAPDFWVDQIICQKECDLINNG